jgi:ubiquinone/menaquinone biosynthesis C-methylase UbiE
MTVGAGPVPGDYEYRGLVAQAWDLLRGDTSEWPDRPFYRALIEQRGGPALDVGCGTGRLTLDYLAAALDVDGVDNSPEMLAICRAKAATLGLDVEGRLFEQEMASLALPRRYATILVPSSSFQLLTDPAAASAALARFHDHLEPNGLLVMSIMSKLWRGGDTPPQMQWTDWRKVGERRRAEDGATVRRWMRTRYDHAGQLEHEENRYEVLRDDIVTQTEFHARSPCVRWYSQAQAIACYEYAGFTGVSVTSGFTFEPPSPNDTTFCVLGARG